MTPYLRMLFRTMLLMLLIVLLVACGSSGGTEESTGAEASTDSEESAEPVVLKFMFWGGPEAPGNWDPIIEKFRAAGHENVTFEYIHQPEDYETKLQTLIAGNETPDVVLFNDAMVAGYAEEGLLLDQGPYYEAMGVNPEEYYIDAALRYIGDELSCVGTGLHTMIMYYNKGIFDEAGMEYPPHVQEEAWTWDEFVNVAKQLSGGEGMNRRYGAYIPPWPTIWRVMVESNGGAFYNEDLKSVALDSPEVAEVIQDLADLRLVEQAAPPVDMIDSLGWDLFLQNDRAAMFIDGTFVMGFLMEWWGEDLGLAVLPKYDEYVTHPIVDCPVVFNNTEHPQEAFEFVQFLTNPEHWMDDYRAGQATPVVRDYLFGDKANEWLDSPTLPDNYASVVVNNLNYTGTNPGFLTSKHGRVEWPVVMPHVYDVLNGEATAQEAMAAAKVEADVVLQEE